MRIAVIPLTRPTTSRPSITYYSFQTRPPPPSQSLKDSPSSGRPPRPGVVKWAVLKVDATWSAFGKAEPGSWRLRLFEFGERFLDKLDFEESMLKRIDVKSASPIKVPEELPDADRQVAETALAQLKIPLLYPPSVSSAPAAISDLQALVQRRIPLHNKGFWTYLLVAPLTAPFMIVPPPLNSLKANIPFFFCAWRSWSHYQALRGARHLDGLLKTGKIVPEADAALDAVYTPTRTDTNPDPKRPVIVTRDSLGHAMRALEMASDETKDILRAYEQAVNRLR
ncbi:mitochondrial K+-H+ exchange-related-domain-containing protein [Mycena pura]|uniref:Mitochondrial K+-H+ exchange-related-domain-containing protein n=1 Tax=Mycena pura TaxID=153505 RepID=A0AAD6Y250_9AGAR|nr:mitochondrial K+-H+ exchange-related-domain-containing protein [Mycena pura]